MSRGVHPIRTVLEIVNDILLFQLSDLEHSLAAGISVATSEKNFTNTDFFLVVSGLILILSIKVNTGPCP